MRWLTAHARRRRGFVPRSLREPREATPTVHRTLMHVFHGNSSGWAKHCPACQQDRVWLDSDAATPKRATGALVGRDKIAAARLRVKVGERLDDPAPAWIQRLALHGNDETPPPEGGGMVELVRKLLNEAYAAGAQRGSATHASISPPDEVAKLDALEQRFRDTFNTGGNDGRLRPGT